MFETESESSNVHYVVQGGPCKNLPNVHFTLNLKKKQNKETHAGHSVMTVSVLTAGVSARCGEVWLLYYRLLQFSHVQI